MESVKRMSLGRVWFSWQKSEAQVNKCADKDVSDYAAVPSSCQQLHSIFHISVEMAGLPLPAPHPSPDVLQHFPGPKPATIIFYVLQPFWFVCGFLVTI